MYAVTYTGEFDQQQGNGQQIILHLFMGNSHGNLYASINNIHGQQIIMHVFCNLHREMERKGEGVGGDLDSDAVGVRTKIRGSSSG
jgi:hypothetical protein